MPNLKMHRPCGARAAGGEAPKLKQPQDAPKRVAGATGAHLHIGHGSRIPFVDVSIERSLALEEALKARHARDVPISDRTTRRFRDSRVAHVFFHRRLQVSKGGKGADATGKRRSRRARAAPERNAAFDGHVAQVVQLRKISLSRT